MMLKIIYLPYDGLFYDTWGDDNMADFSASLSTLVKQGGVATWWNILSEENNYYNIPNVTYIPTFCKSSF